VSKTEEQKQSVSMRDVAVLAGVSHQTVSRVLNNHPSIRPATRERVLQVIDEVNYRPNNAARALATRKSNRIGVLVDNPTEFGPSATLRAVEEAARSAGYTVSAVTVDESRALSPHSAVEHLIAQGVDALCIVTPRASSVDLLREHLAGIPTLVVKAEPEESFLTASIDQRLGAILAVDHLVSLGHREILHVAGPLDWFDARGREQGWFDRMQELKLPSRPIVIGDWTSDFGYAFAKSITSIPDFTAVFAANDQMALGVIHGLVSNGIRVPEDISVVGFDDLSDARHFLPPLTTIRQNFEALGRRSVEMLLAELDGRDSPHRTLIEPELVVRESTATPRS
jgi:DNA-binding LacI/PurR family transcriptional regulator